MDLEKFAALREAAGLTLEELAERVGCTPVAMRQVSCGKREPSLGMTRRIASALGCTVAELIKS